MALAAIRSLAVLSLAALAAIALRAALGPFHIGALHFASPIGVESVFAAGFLAVLLLRSGAAEGGKTKASLRAAPLWIALAVVAAVFLPNLRDPFLSDDYILVRHATLDPSRILAMFHTPGGDGSFRPLGYLYFGLLRYFGGVDSWKWHACALAVHLVNCALLYLIVWTLWHRTELAFTAAVLFGLNGTRPESVAWSAGNFDLLACAFTLAAMLAILRRRTWIALPLLVLAILSKESAYAAPAVIFGFAAAASRLRDSRMRL